MQHNSRNVSKTFGSIVYFFFSKVVRKIINYCLGSIQEGLVGEVMDPWAKAGFDPGQG